MAGRGRPYLATVEIVEKLLQLTRFTVYLEGIQNKNTGYFHIEIMISAVHMLEAIRGHVPKGYFKKKIGAIWCGLIHIFLSDYVLKIF